MSKALQIKDFPNYYVTDTGEIYSRNYGGTGRIKKLKQRLNKAGYMRIGLHKDGKYITLSVHRLVAQAFIPNPENKPEINHKNGITTDNRVENLEFCTRSENMQHAFRVLKRKPSGDIKPGRDCPLSRPVLQLKNGEIIAEYAGTREAERHTGISHVNICQCCNNKKCYKTAHGYEWKYK